MSPTVVLGSFFTALTMFLSSTAVVFLGLPVQRLLLSTPVVSFFFRTFQMVVLAMTNVYAMALIDFPSTLSFTIAFLFTHRHLYGFLVGYTSNFNYNLHRQNPSLKLSIDVQHYLLFE